MVLSKPPDQLLTIPVDVATLQKNLLQILSRTGRKIVWQDNDAEAIFDPEAFRVGLRRGLIVAEIPLATDQTKFANILITLSVGTSPENAALVATTPKNPAGHKILTSRWGHLTQDLLWTALLNFGQNIVHKEMGQGKMKLGGLYCTDELLHIIPIPHYTVDQLVKLRR